jgi:hypothetical protein
MTAIRIARSFVAAESVAELIAAEYDVRRAGQLPLFSKLLRTQDNDHYLATAGDGTQYAFRIYQQGDRYHRAESDYLYEIDWLNFLRDHATCPSPTPFRRRMAATSKPAGSAGRNALLRPVQRWPMATRCR